MGILPDDLPISIVLSPEEAAAIVAKTTLVKPQDVDDALLAVSTALAGRAAGQAAVDTVLQIGMAIAKIGLKVVA